MYIIIYIVNGVSESNNRALMTSHAESRRGARPPGADDGGQNQSLQKYKGVKTLLLYLS